jgi:hypothetical protein
MTRPESMAALLIELIGARVDATAHTRPTGERLLDGLDGVFILDAGLSVDLASEVSSATLRNALLKGLESAGVSVLAPQEGLVLGAVRLSLAGVRAPGGNWAVCAVLDVRQRARLLREPGPSFDAVTWSSEATCISTADALERDCCSLVQRVATDLGNAFRSRTVSEPRGRTTRA